VLYDPEGYAGGVVTTIAGGVGPGFPPGPVPGMLSPWGVVPVGTTLYVTTSNAITQVTAVS
jgi:hypothetical protein